MSCNTRRVSVVLLALFMAVSAYWLERGQAQYQKAEVKQAAPPMAGKGKGVKGGAGNPAVDPDGFLRNGMHLVKDEKGRGKAIEAAIDYIADGEWKTAVERLQKLLKINEDVFVRLKRKNDEGKDVYVWVSAKQEADRLIGSLPPLGMDFYKATYGEVAAELLKKAKKNGDPALLNDIMKLYAHTDAGAEAIKLLGDYKFDRGEYMPALLCYSKIINRLGEEKAPISLLAKAAWAAHLAPPSSSGQNTITVSSVYSEKELWKMLKSRTREIQFGEQTLSPEELEDYVVKLDRSRMEQNASDAMLYRASLSRSNQLVGGPAFMEREWGQPMLVSAGDSSGAGAAKENINKAKSALKQTNQPLIPGFAPIALTATGGRGEKIPLLVYKDYFGIMARDLRNGSIAWMSNLNGSLQTLLGASGQKQSAVRIWLDYYHNQHPQMIFENSTIGSLSSDGRFVYTIDDLAIPPQPQMNMNGMFVNPGMQNNSMDSELEKAAGHNQLNAFSLDRNSGKLSWTLPDGEKDPLVDHYFLGPPLPLAGKLYVLAEKQQEIRLVCIDPTSTVRIEAQEQIKPSVVSIQTLGLTEEKMQNDPLRRSSAAHLAYGEGILVCPTNAGAIFGVNLLENSLAWAYPYRDNSDAPPEQPNFNNGRIRQWPPPGFRQLPNGQLVPINNNPNHPWKVTAPVIAEGKIVFAAPDARSLHCINLRDGALVWRRSKQEDDLYLGNVYNGIVVVVGKKYVRGLSLAAGETVWTLETGAPSGQGIGSDNVYYLPVHGKSEDGRDAQILGIDMERGKIVSRSKGRARQLEDGKAVYDVPGNLLFHEGKVVSLTADEVAVYPQVKFKLAEMDEEILKNPNDPKALTERGDLRLDKGDLPGAIDDLTTALKNHPPKELRQRARAKLYDTLTAYIADHFNDAEKYLKGYEDLCKLDVESASEAERGKLEAEQHRRRATFLWLVGKGREEQGRLVEAFENYQRFAAEAGNQSELVPAVDDSQVKAAPDVWARGRIAAMMNKAKPEHRQPLEKLIADKWDKLRQTNDLNELRAFVRTFGSVSNAGKEARLELVERLMEQKEGGDEHPLLEAELELNQFRTGRHSPELAARATEALARLYTRKGLLEDAAYCYRKLGKEYAKTVVRDGKTGEQIFEDDAATDKRLIPYLDDPLPLGSVNRFDSRAASGPCPAPGGGELFQFEHSGERLPYFRHHIVGLKFGKHEFMLLDRRLEDDNRSPKVAWSSPLANTSFQTLAMQVLGNDVNNRLNRGGVPIGMPGMPGNVAPPNPLSRFCYSTVGHLIVLPVGHRVFGIDPVNRRKLWEKDLMADVPGLVAPDSSGNGPGWNNNPPAVDPRDGSVLLTYQGGWAQRLGQVSPFEGQIVCVQSRDKLSALDPLTGRVLWSRLDVNSRNFLFSDDEYVFVVELDNQNKPTASRVFRAADGMSVKAPDFSAQFSSRLQVFGRYLLLSESSPTNGVTVRLYDMATGEDAWKQNYPARSVVAHSEEAGLTGVVEPEGKVHVLDLKKRKEVLAGQISDPAEQLKGAKRFTLLADRLNYYFAAQPAEQNALQMGMPLPNNVTTHLGMRTVHLNGFLHAFDRSNGEHRWYYEVKNQYLILDQFRELPLIFLTARGGDMPNPQMNMPGGGNWTPHVTTIDKKGCRTAFDKSLPNNASPFFGTRINPRENTIELLSQNYKITHFPMPPKAQAKPAAETPKEKDTAVPQRKASESRAARPAFDRARIREIAPPLPPG
jgi:outer membrane protein assembly factor BamB/tetratricopeptide (TPR) repeat protein